MISVPLFIFSGNNQVTYYEIDSPFGHDTFLLDLNDVGAGMKGFLETDLIQRGRAVPLNKPKKL